MASNRNHLPEDWAEIFENRVRSVGVWCDTKASDKLRHFFVCRNPKANIAISRCGQIIATFDKLHENVLSLKCLVCELYETGGKEVRELNSVRLDAVIESRIQTQTINKE